MNVKSKYVNVNNMYINEDYVYSRECKQGVKDFDIDNLDMRKKVSSKYMYWNVNGLSSKSKHHHGFDTYDNSKILSSMNKRKCKPCVNLAGKRYQVLVNGVVKFTLKENALLNKCKSLSKQGVKFSVKEVYTQSNQVV